MEKKEDKSKFQDRAYVWAEKKLKTSNNWKDKTTFFTQYTNFAGMVHLGYDKASEFLQTMDTKTSDLLEMGLALIASRNDAFAYHFSYPKTFIIYVDIMPGKSSYPLKYIRNYERIIFVTSTSVHIMEISQYLVNSVRISSFLTIIGQPKTTPEYPAILKKFFMDTDTPTTIETIHREKETDSLKAYELLYFVEYYSRNRESPILFQLTSAANDFQFAQPILEKIVTKIGDFLITAPQFIDQMNVFVPSDYPNPATLKGKISNTLTDMEELVEFLTIFDKYLDTFDESSFAQDAALFFKKKTFSQTKLLFDTKVSMGPYLSHHLSQSAFDPEKAASALLLTYLAVKENPTLAFPQSNIDDIDNRINLRFIDASLQGEQERLYIERWNKFLGK
jgi:hypothetical protein